MSEKLNLVDTILDYPKFAILFKILKASGLIETFKGTGPFTILAPSNLAFTKLSESKLDDMIKPLNRENLAELIKYHVIEGRVMSADLIGMTTAETLQGQLLTIETTDFGFKINGANIQSRDIEASNGVVHSINAVLFPAIATKAIESIY